MRTLLRAALVAVVTASVATPLVATEAQASTCPTWSSEQDLINTTDPRCRSTWIIDPGVGNLVSRQQLFQHADVLARHGFSREWLWYARETTITVPPESLQRWVSCPVDLHYGGVCPVGPEAVRDNPIRWNFSGGPVTFHVFEYGGAFIMRACANYWFPLPPLVPSPNPSVRIAKFDDRNRDGVRGGGESPLGGWTFQVHRVASEVGQPAGHVGTVTTGGDGTARFHLAGHGPGTYRIDEVTQNGWAPTTPASQTVHVPQGTASDEVASLTFGNAETRADLVKVAFSLVDPPQRLETGQGVDLTVRAVLRNNGPADVTAEDSVDVTAPSDCTVEPAHAAVTRPLPRGAQTTVDLPVRVTCAQPSFHALTFTDRLRVSTGGVTDPFPENNTVAFQHVVPVFGDADIRAANASVTCPPRSDVNERFDCTVTADVENAGPFGPVDTHVVTEFQAPEDCTATTDAARTTLSLAADRPRAVSSVWSVVCSRRSHHPVAATVTATLDHLHVEDHEPGNGVARATTTPEIFDSADLSVDSLDVRCTEREASATDSRCTATTVVGNAGPATRVELTTDLAISVAAGCRAEGDGTSSHDATLDSGATTTETTTWRIVCSTADRHGVTVTATARTDEPHAEDRDPADNTASVTWAPVDVKPRSLPSAVNVGKQGVIPFAVLSTADMDALTDVAGDSLRLGVTGTEDSVLSCSPTGEDVNDDGRPDLVCHADTPRTGVRCTTEVLLLTGRLTDGTPLRGEDDIKTVGCRR